MDLVNVAPRGAIFRPNSIRYIPRQVFAVPWSNLWRSTDFHPWSGWYSPPFWWDCCLPLCGRCLWKGSRIFRVVGIGAVAAVPNSASLVAAVIPQWSERLGLSAGGEALNNIWPPGSPSILMSRWRWSQRKEERSRSSWRPPPAALRLLCRAQKALAAKMPRRATRKRRKKPAAAKCKNLQFMRRLRGWIAEAALPRSYPCLGTYRLFLEKRAPSPSVRFRPVPRWNKDGHLGTM